MTVSTSESVIQYDGNGATVAFPVPFRFLASADLVVTKTSAAGIDTILVMGADYSVSGAGALNGGSVTTTVAPATGEHLTISREMTPIQETDLRNQGKYFAQTHENVFDFLTMLIQQSLAGTNGSIRVSKSDPEPNRLPGVVSRANLLMGFDSNGNPIAVAPISGSASDLALQLINALDPTKGTALIGHRGRTLRNRLDDSVSVKDFGAVGDGSTDDTSAIQAALDSSFQNVFFPEGEYLVSSPLVVSGFGKTIYGLNPGTTRITAAHTTGDILTVNAAYSRVRGLWFHCYLARTSGIHVSLANSLSVVEDCEFRGHFIGIKTIGAINRILNCVFQEPSPGATHIHVSGGDTSQTIDFCLMGGTNASIGILTDNSAALIISNTSVLEAAQCLRVAPGNGQFVASLKAHDCFFDTADYGIVLNTSGTGQINRMKFIDCWTSSMSQYGVLIDSSTGGPINGVDFICHEGQLNALDGVILIGSNTQNIRFNGGTFCQNGGAGISIQNGVTNTHLNDVHAGAGDGLSGNATGLFVGTGCTGTKINNCNFVGNTGSQVNSSTTLLAAGNVGYKTKNNGSAQINSGTTSIVVNHGLARTPLVGELIVCPSSGLASASEFWVGGLTSIQFTISVDANPGTNITFNWMADLESR